MVVGNKVKCKIWALAVAYGNLGQFEPNQYEKKGKMFVSSTKWGLGENVALRLMECLPPTVCCHIFMNNNFKSFRLFTQQQL